MNHIVVRGKYAWTVKTTDGHIKCDEQLWPDKAKKKEKKRKKQPLPESLRVSSEIQIIAPQKRLLFKPDTICVLPWNPPKVRQVIFLIT